VFFQAGCNACHTISGISNGTVGPVLDGLVSRAGEAVSGLSAEEYIRQSLLDPSAFIVEGFQDGVMPQTFGDTLSEEQINDLVAFLLTLQ
jgi:mono/diheme cytochrome c family protein